MRLLALSVLFVCTALIGCDHTRQAAPKPEPGSKAAQLAELDDAFANLQDPAFSDLRNTTKTDAGYARLKSLGASSADNRAYIASKLPQMIAAGPTVRFFAFDPRWRNELDLADDLKIVEAAPAMVQQIKCCDSGIVSGYSAAWNLGFRPAALALVDMGDVAVPTLKEGLENPDAETAFLCARVLEEMDTPVSKSALTDTAWRRKHPEQFDEIAADMKENARWKAMQEAYAKAHPK